MIVDLVSLNDGTELVYQRKIPRESLQSAAWILWAPFLFSTSSVSCIRAAMPHHRGETSRRCLLSLEKAIKSRMAGFPSTTTSNAIMGPFWASSLGPTRGNCNQEHRHGKHIETTKQESALKTAVVAAAASI